MFKSFNMSHLKSAAASFALLVSLAPTIAAQDTNAAPQNQTPQTQTAQQQQPQTTAPPAQTAATPAGEAVAAKPAAPEPLYREYRGVTLGMKAAEVRAKLGKPQEKSDEMDFYVFSDRERARVYYTDGKATAVIATYIGKDGGAPPPVAVLGAEVEAKPDGSMYMMKPYREAGYWVAYSRTPGDSPMTIITMQKTP